MRLQALVPFVVGVSLLAGCAGKAPAPTSAPASSSVPPAPTQSNQPAETTRPAEPPPLQPEPLILGFDAMSITGAPIHFAADAGIFKKYGLDVKLVYVAGGTKLTQTLVAGEVEIGQNGYSSSVSAAASGAQLVLIGGISNTMPFQLMSKPEIKTPQDLKGKKIAISTFGSSTDTSAKLVISHYKLDPASVAVLQIGGEPERVSALKSGQVDAILTQYPTTGILADQGYHILAEVADIGGEYPNTAYVTSRQFLRKRPEVARRFMMAMVETLHRYRTEKDAALAATAKFLKVDDPKTLAQTHAYYSEKIFPRVPRASVEGVTNLLASEAKKKTVTITARDIVDNSMLDALEKEGFVQKITGGK